MGLTTLLCKDCNERHGRLQDKWFGEHLRVVANNGSIIAARAQRGFFKVGGVRVGGRFRERAGGGIIFQYWPHKTSPNSLKQAEDYFDRSTIEIKVPIPLLEKRSQQLVSMGFLTAAYLMLFRELGYSWALQAHLDPVRRQIRDPDAEILPGNFSATSTKVLETPWTGVGQFGGELVLVVAISDRVVFLPPFYRRDFYEAFPRTGNVNFEWLGEFRFYKDHACEGPIAILSGDRMLVIPDVYFESSSDRSLIYLPQDGSDPQIMDFVTEDEFERQGNLPDVKTMEVETL